MMPFHHEGRLGPIASTVCQSPSQTDAINDSYNLIGKNPNFKLATKEWGISGHYACISHYSDVRLNFVLACLFLVLINEKLVQDGTLIQRRALLSRRSPATDDNVAAIGPLGGFHLAFAATAQPVAHDERVFGRNG